MERNSTSIYANRATFEITTKGDRITALVHMFCSSLQVHVHVLGRDARIHGNIDAHIQVYDCVYLVRQRMGGHGGTRGRQLLHICFLLRPHVYAHEHVKTFICVQYLYLHDHDVAVHRSMSDEDFAKIAIPMSMTIQYYTLCTNIIHTLICT
jgi:hypothetical protein